MNRRKLHTPSLIVGAIVALAIALSPYLSPDRFCTAKKASTETAAKKDKADDGSGPFISLPTFSLPTPTGVQANLDSYCLFEIVFNENNDKDEVVEPVIHTDRLLETMFQVIISPNAP